MSQTDPNYDEREQSEIKHYALRLYLEAATLIIGSSRNLRYVDCCAGPWEERSPDYSDTSFGIAVNTLRQSAQALQQRGLSPRFGALLIEKGAVAFDKLDAFAKRSDSPELPIHARNWDFTERLDDIVKYCRSSDSFSFIFIDPKGWQLAGISKIRPLLRLSPGEVLINLMSSFMARFIKDNKTDFTDLLGSDFPQLRRLSGPDLESAIINKYCELIKREGEFDYVCSLPVMNPDMDSFNFHLIYATRHRKGVKVFKDVERRTEEKTHIIRAELQQKDRESRSGIRELFGPEVKYRENCYQRLARSNKLRAREEVKVLINSKLRVSYDSCWGVALQISAVYETDLRKWIEAWEKEGVVTVEGRRPGARVLSVSKNLFLLKVKEITN